MNASALVLLTALTLASPDSAAETELPTQPAPAEKLDASPLPLESTPEETTQEDDPFFAGSEIEEVVIETVIEPTEPHEASIFEKVAHLHPMVVHMPIAWLLLLVMLEWLLIWRSAFVSDTARITLWALTMVSFLPSLITGLFFSEFVYEGSAEEVLEPILEHRNEILISSGLLALGWFVRRRRPDGPATALVLTAAMIAMIVGAHSGGLLVYGEDYFPF